MVKRSFFLARLPRATGALASASIALAALAFGPSHAVAQTSAADSASGYPVLNADRMLEGFAIYRQHCASCHDNPSGSTPGRSTLGGFSRERIYAALTTGPMQPMAAGLSDEQKRTLAVTLPQEKPLPEPDLGTNLCGANAPGPGKGADWPAWSPGLGNTRFQPNGGLNAVAVPKLKLRWAFAYPGGVGSLPVIADGRLYSASATGQVFALNARTGCTYWTAKVPAEVRGAPVIGTAGPKPALFVADADGNVVAFDAMHGGTLWSMNVFGEKGHRISGSPVLYDDRLYVPLAAFEIPLAPNPAYPCCKTRGGLAAIDAGTGKLLWKSDVFAEPVTKTKANAAGTQNFGPAGGSVWSAPTVDPQRGLVYVSTGNAYTEPAPDGSDAVVAFDMKTGRREWVSEVLAGDAWLAGCDKHPHPNCPSKLGPDADIGMPPALVTTATGKQLLIAGSKSGIAYAFDPDNRGKIVWHQRLAKSNPLGSLIFGVAIEGSTVYLPISYDQPEGGLAALDIATGRQTWRAAPAGPTCAWGRDFCSAAQRSPPTAIPGVVFSGSNDGHIRAYSTSSGAIVWDYDTGQSVAAVNGVTAKGGAMGRGGQTVAEGMLFVNAGAGIGPSGNALLAFSAD
ncbi:PQQ-binding-like beta-propeller repeat protein [Burkholderia anthina]|uniref:outer membrane protein assembly factor BamB family protein n=1 Tax=Burkholderia anthina TaxID=179879 RepID=UPI001589B769|nr:PQQ-binding-like beta-propeller repeat protein [Burkholderia anthina]